MMIELLIFQRPSVFQLACLLEIQGLAESEVCPTSWCLFLLMGVRGPPPSLGKPTREAGLHISVLFPTPAGSLRLALMLREKKLAEGSRAGLSQNTCVSAACVLVSPPWWHVTSSCNPLLGAKGTTNPSPVSFPSLISTERKEEAPCPQLKGKARLTFLTLQQMLSQPRLSECQSKHQSFTVC